MEETQAEMARLQDLADAVMNIAEPKVTFRLIQVRQRLCTLSNFLSSFASAWESQQLEHRADLLAHACIACMWSEVRSGRLRVG